MSHRSTRPTSSQSMNAPEDRELAQRRALDVLFEMSSLLNTGLDRKQLELSISLLERGTNPEALAMAIKELRSEANSRK